MQTSLEKFVFNLKGLLGDDDEEGYELFLEDSLTILSQLESAIETYEKVGLYSLTIYLIPC